MHSNCQQRHFPFEYTQINITLIHTHPHTCCIIYVKELSVRLSAVSTNDAYEYERKMSVFAFNLRGMRLCTLTIMGTDVSVPLRIRIIQFNSIQFDTTRFGMGRFDFDFDCDFTFQHIKSKLAISQSWAQCESPRPLPVLCVCVCVNDSALKNRSL